MAEVRHKTRICLKCGKQLPMEAETCSWCHTPVSAPDEPQRIRVRKKRSVLKTYFEHVRRHWIYFLLAILAAGAVAWMLLEYAQRPARQSEPAPASIVFFR